MHRLPMKLLRAGVAGLALGLAGCGNLLMQSGNPFDPAQVDKLLAAGGMRQAQVQAALGVPYGKGSALMPFHESARSVWTYSFSEITLEAGGSTMHLRQVMLFVFFDGDRLDGYMWLPMDLRGRG